MKRVLIFQAILALTIIFIFPTQETRANDPQKLIEDAAALAKSLLTDPKWSAYRPHFQQAKGIVLAPDVIRAGLVVGGSGGQCIVIARKKNVQQWSSPSFCAIGEATIGLQIGFEKLEVMLLIMNDNALARIASGTATLGGEAGMSVGLIGSTIESATTPTLDFNVELLAFARGQGLYGGVTLDGGYIGPDNTYNHAYYGQNIAAEEILFHHKVNSPHANMLHDALQYGE